MKLNSKSESHDGTINSVFVYLQIRLLEEVIHQQSFMLC
jgi:hypothetical protein